MKKKSPRYAKYQLGGKAAFSPLAAAKNKAFQDWYKESTIEGRNNIPFSDKLDYDYFSYYMNGEPLYFHGDHFPDTYKRPNHQTFSNESVYSTPENPGGRWEGNKYIPMKRMQQGGISNPNAATAADSLALYNNTNAVMNYYKKNPSYKFEEPYYSNYMKKDVHKENDLLAEQTRNSPNYVHGTDTGSRTIQPWEYRFNAKNPNQYYQRETAAAILDMRAPYQLFDRRVKPTGFGMASNINPNDQLFGDAITMSLYDPVAVKPWAMLTPEERKLRIQRYGNPTNQGNINSTLQKQSQSPVVPTPQRPPIQYQGHTPVQTPNTQGLPIEAPNRPMPVNPYVQDFSTPTKYSFTYPTGVGQNGQKTMYFPTKEMLDAFSRGARGVSSQEGNDYKTATGYYQVGGKYDGVKDFYTGYINSPKYRERLEGMGYNAQDVIDTRLKSLNKVKYKNTNDSGSYYDPSNNTVRLDSTDADFFNTQLDTVAAHETSHSVGAMRRQSRFNPGLLGLNDQELVTIKSRNKLDNYQGTDRTQIHDSRPTELKADIDALRYRLKTDGIYDTGTQDFNADYLKKAKEKYKGDKELERIFNRLDDEDLIYIMNNVAQQNQASAPHVKRGGTMKKYQAAGLVALGEHENLHADGIATPSNYQTQYDPFQLNTAGFGIMAAYAGTQALLNRSNDRNYQAYKDRWLRNYAVPSLLRDPNKFSSEYYEAPIYAKGGGLDRDQDYGSKSHPYPGVSSGDFAGPHRSYPIPTHADAVDALRLAHLHGAQGVVSKVCEKYPDLCKKLGGMLEDYAYGGIHINPNNKGKFNATKKRTGKTTEELTHSKNPTTRKRAIFAQNARKWHHQDGGLTMNTPQDQAAGYYGYPNATSLTFPGSGERTFVPGPFPLAVKDDRGTQIMANTPVKTYGTVTEIPIYEDGGEVKHAKKVKRGDATIEAEKGELIFGAGMPGLVTDQEDRIGAGLYKIGGKKHYEGGTPLKAYPGDFVFSNDKSLQFTEEQAKDTTGDEVKKAKERTPAKLASKYLDLNKFIEASQNKEEDRITRKTAILNINNYIDRLAEIAYVQEQKKGFPTGIPAFAQTSIDSRTEENGLQESLNNYKYGGQVKFQTGGTWGLWGGDKLPTFRKRYGVPNSADKVNDLDQLASTLGYTGPHNNTAFQEWLYNSSPENKSIIDKWHNAYNVGPLGGRPDQGKFDGKLGIRWTNAINEIIDQNNPMQPIEHTTPLPDLSYTMPTPSNRSLVPTPPEKPVDQYVSPSNNQFNLTTAEGLNLLAATYPSESRYPTAYRNYEIQNAKALISSTGRPISEQPYLNSIARSSLGYEQNNNPYGAAGSTRGLAAYQSRLGAENQAIGQVYAQNIGRQDQRASALAQLEVQDGADRIANSEKYDSKLEMLANNKEQERRDRLRNVSNVVNTMQASREAKGLYNAMSDFYQINPDNSIGIKPVYKIENGKLVPYQRNVADLIRSTQPTGTQYSPALQLADRLEQMGYTREQIARILSRATDDYDRAARP